MARKRRRSRSQPLGASPGTLHAPAGAIPPVVRTMAWGPDRLDEGALGDLSGVPQLLHDHTITWVDVKGLGDTKVLEQLETVFPVHRLALEDVLNVWQRPKIDSYENHRFLVVRMPPGEDGTTQQLSAFFGPSWVVTFQERPGTWFEPLRERIRQGKPRLRTGSVPYFAYALLDVLVDSWLPAVEAVRDQIDALEDEVLAGAGKDLPHRIHALKRELSGFRRELAPMRELVAELFRELEADDDTAPFTRDLVDHVHLLLDEVEAGRDAATGLLDLHLSLTSHGQNEVMRVLTIIATLFIPLSFIAGLYGMNFDPSASRWNMPELHLPWGYPAVLAVMGTVAAIMLAFFHRRGWFR